MPLAIGSLQLTLPGHLRRLLARVGGQRLARTGLSRRGAPRREAFSADHARTLSNHHQLIGGHIGNLLLSSVRPANLQVHRRCGPEPEVQPAIVDRQIGRLGQHRLGLPPLAVRGDHLRSDRAAVRAAPTSSTLSQWFAPLTSLRSSDGGSFMLTMRMSMSPSLSKSPKATPRLECASLIPGPASPSSSSNFPSAQIAKNDAAASCMGYQAASPPPRDRPCRSRRRVGKAIVVQVRNSCAPAHKPGFHPQAGPHRHVPKDALAVVAIEDRSIVAEMRLENVQGSVRYRNPRCPAPCPPAPARPRSVKRRSPDLAR